MEAQLKHITISEAEASKENALWVVNSSNPRGIVHLNTRDGMGNSVAVSITTTWIPLDLTTQATKHAIISSPEFRKLVTMGLLKVVSPESAILFMESADAQKEAQRVYNRLSEMDANEVRYDAPQQVKDTMAEKSNSEVSAFSRNVANSTDLDEDQVMSMVRGNASIMSKADFLYVANNTQHAKVKTFCMENL